MSFSAAKRRVLPLILLFVFLFEFQSLVGLVINDIEPYKCGPQNCQCTNEVLPVCANIKKDKKELVTYSNPCLFLCDAKCLETSVRFFHCGQCDPNRNFTAKGDKGDPKDFECLKFVMKEGQKPPP